MTHVAKPRSFNRFLFAVLVTVATASPAAAGPTVLTGIDVLIERGFETLQARRVGLIANPTAISRDLRNTVDILHAAPEVRLVKLFGPEHGVRGDVPAGEHIGDSVDDATGLPMLSLYGPTRKPTPEMLAGLDTLVFDVQDIGSRSYTYISTMAVAMEAAAEHGLRFVVLDRPNPLGGERLEGRPLDLEYRSFVGYLPIPYCHGMTVGELARMINGEGWLPKGQKCDLTVVPMRGWRRGMTFLETGLHWVPSSPHVPNADTPFFYAATGIMGELGVISEGVGYPLPFEVVGHPSFDANRFSRELNARKIPGIRCMPYHFRPYYGPNKGKHCAGARMVLTDPHLAPLTEVQFHVMDIARRLHPDLKLFGGNRDRMFDKVCGTNQIRELLVSGRPIEEILIVWRSGVAEFRIQRRPYLLYD